ncbi:MAG: VWA domain-containing protein [Clostridiaceae bacterium]|jgi:hypothetical protein|nr:VWA domain-containing protein [Clostridiaceae bacterium]
MHKNKRGLTLVELILAVTLLTTVLSLAFSMLLGSLRAQSTGFEEASLQSSARIVSETVNQVVRYSSAVFTIPKSSFREDNLTEGWDYIGLSADQTEIVRYSYNGTSHNKETLVEPQPGITYTLRFQKEEPDNSNKVLRFIIEAFKGGASQGRLAIETQLEALNSLQIIDRGTLADAATAVAYRDDSRPFAVVGTIAMVFDTSGSMKEDVDGDTTYQDSKEKINILKVEADKLVDGFAKEDNLYISLVPFATSANGTYNFVNAKSHATQLKNQIDDMDAIGGTNTGDGMRRAYYAIKAYNEQPSLDVTPKNFMIILVDGETTYASGTQSGGGWWNPVTYSYITRDGNVNENNEILGTGNTTTTVVTNYDQMIAQTVNDYVSGTGNDIKVYAISFSKSQTLFNHIRSVAITAGASSANVYPYSDDRDLGAIFDAIRQDILNDLWVVNGPA